MVRCPNCGQKTSGDYCQYCKSPILSGGSVGMSFRDKVGGWIACVLCCLLGAFILVSVVLLSTVTPREALKEVRGRVSACHMLERPSGSHTVSDIVEAQLAGYDRTLTFRHPSRKVGDVYRGLQVGADVILLVEEYSGGRTAGIWEGRSNGNVFLHYETTAQWHKSNKKWGLTVGSAFLLIGIGVAAWMIVKR